MIISQTPSPNFNDRKADIDMLVFHYTGMESGEAALSRMREASAEVSAHYMVWEDGRVTQLVEEQKRAWHAGVGTWQGDTDLNSCSIGIEIVNGGHNVPLDDGSLPPYPDAQIASVISLAKAILDRHFIPQARVVGHSDIAPMRKEDPGEHFPWARLAEAGIGYWPGRVGSLSAMPLALIGRGLGRADSGSAVSRIKGMLAAIGYDLAEHEDYDEQLEAVIAAFQRRWRPERVSGQADLETLSLIVAVSDALGEQHG